jgi:hypothetical protein
VLEVDGCDMLEKDMQHCFSFRPQPPLYRRIFELIIHLLLSAAFLIIVIAAKSSLE